MEMELLSRLRPLVWTGLLALAGCASSAADPGEGSAPAAAVELETVTDMQGREHDLTGVLEQGRPVALIFWQTWCASCLAEAPALVAAAGEYGERIEFIGVVPGPDDLVDDEEVARVAARFGMPYPQVRDRDLRLSRAFDVQGTPTIAVVGAEGELLHLDHHAPDWSKIH